MREVGPSEYQQSLTTVLKFCMFARYFLYHFIGLSSYGDSLVILFPFCCDIGVDMFGSQRIFDTAL